MGARVEPGKAALQRLHLELSAAQILLVDGRDLQFAALAGLDVLGDLHHAVGIEVEAHDGVVALRMGRFLLDAEAVALAVKLRHAIALRVVDIISEDGRLVLSLCIAHALLEQPREARAVEDVVAQDEADAVLAHKLLADDESLGQSVGTRLLGIAEAHTQLAAIAQQTAEARQVVGRGDDEDVADAGEHQRRDGIIDHRLVIYGDELLADALGDGVEAGAGSASQNDSFHVVFLFTEKYLRTPGP